MHRLYKRIGAALCAVFAAAGLSVSLSVRGEELADGFPRSFDFRNLILAADASGEEFCAFCGATWGGKSALVFAYDVPEARSRSEGAHADGRSVCLPTDVYGDGIGVTEPVEMTQVYPEGGGGAFAVYYTEDFDPEYFSLLGEVKMSPLSSVSVGDVVYIAAFDNPDEIVTDYGYVAEISGVTMTLITNEQWAGNSNITWEGAPLINERGEIIGVLAPVVPMLSDSPEVTLALACSVDFFIDYLKDCDFSALADSGKNDRNSGENSASSGGGSSENGGNTGMEDRTTEEIADTEPTAETTTAAAPAETATMQPQRGSAEKGMEAGGAVWIVLALLVIAAAIAAVIAAVCIAGKKKKSAVSSPQNYGQPSPRQPIPPAATTEPPQSQGQPYPQQSETPAARLVLKCTGGILNGSSTPISGTLYIGRNPTLCNVLYPEGAVNIDGMHCNITVANGQAQLTDTGSAAGTFINGVRILPNVPYPIPIGSGFTVGSPENTFMITE